ncbi:CBS domain-containing protein [Bacteroidota bacterium]
MLAKELITRDIPTLSVTDTGEEALDLMDSFKVIHLPIVDNRDYLGLISEKNIQDMNLFEKALGNFSNSLINPYVYGDQHIYDVIGLVSDLKLTVIPVIDNKKEFLGLITMYNLINNISKVSAVTEPGGIILLELNINDYSVTEIANIVESNNARILSLFITSPKDTTKIELTLKINRKELSSIIRSFERYGYVIKASFQKDDKLTEWYENRYESFLRYLNT